jgi:hypothetical protein
MTSSSRRHRFASPELPSPTLSPTIDETEGTGEAVG